MDVFSTNPRPSVIQDLTTFAIQGKLRPIYIGANYLSADKLLATNSRYVQGGRYTKDKHFRRIEA